MVFTIKWQFSVQCDIFLQRLVTMSDGIWKLRSSGNSACNMTYFEAVGYYGFMVYGSYDHVPIQAAIWHILTVVGYYGRMVALQCVVWYGVT